MERNAISVIPARPTDVSLLLDFIRELAAYEGKSDAVTARETDIAGAFFGESPVIEGLIAWIGDEPVGFATYYMKYSTFAGRPGLYLEDLYVRETGRRNGVGTVLMARLANLATARQCNQMTWSVLHWNESALSFYLTLGATVVSEWKTLQLSAGHLEVLASGDRPF